MSFITVQIHTLCIAGCDGREHEEDRPHPLPAVQRELRPPGAGAGDQQHRDQPQ